MKWDSSRSVPWKRLCIEWAVVAVVVAIVSFAAADNRSLSSYLALVLGGVVYLAVGAAMAKLGYQRKTLKQMRAEVAAAPTRTVGSRTANAVGRESTARPRPAPTKRTSGAPGQRSRKRRR